MKNRITAALCLITLFVSLFCTFYSSTAYAAGDSKLNFSGLTRNSLFQAASTSADEKTDEVAIFNTQKIPLSIVVNGKEYYANKYYYHQNKLSYGTPGDIKGNDYDPQNDPRYLGYTMKGIPYTNDVFQVDAGGKWNPADRNDWIEFPWQNSNVYAPAFTPSAKAGIHLGVEKDWLSNGYWINAKKVKYTLAQFNLPKPIENYVTVIQDPEDYCDGAGQIYHGNATIGYWYLAIIFPHTIHLIDELIPDPVVTQFKIKYNGNYVTDGIIQVTRFPVSITLEDASTGAVTLRNWYVYNPGNASSTEISSSQNLTTVGKSISSTELDASGKICFRLKNNNNDALSVVHGVTINITSNPVLGINANPTSVKINESFVISDGSLPSAGGDTIVSWEVEEDYIPEGGGATQIKHIKGFISSKSDFFKPYSKADPGRYIYKLTYVRDNIGQTATGLVSVEVLVSKNTFGPVAIIDSINSALPNTTLTIDGSGSYDPDHITDPYNGIVFNQWGLPSEATPVVGDTPNGSNRLVQFSKAGTYPITLTVTDSDGMTGTTTRNVVVLPPKPTAFLTYHGIFKENHKFTVSGKSSISPSAYPINKYVFTITAISGCALSDIKYHGYPDTTALSVDEINMLSKKQGRIKIGLTVINTAGLSDYTEIYFDITPDLPPVADFKISDTGIMEYRDANNVPYGLLTISDASYSPDGDPIGRRIYYEVYNENNNKDANGNPIFDDEIAAGERIVVYDGTNVSANFQWNLVGARLIDIEVEEVLDASNSIPEFITPADIQKGSTLNRN